MDRTQTSYGRSSYIRSRRSYDTKNGGWESEVKSLSLFGRFNYDYKNKYLFEANIRYDGSSKFATGHKWGTFPSFSTGWRISEENFMKDHIRWIDELKLRASWGQLGNEKYGVPMQEQIFFR